MYMMNKVQKNDGKGVYFIVGSDTTSGHHTSNFDINEDDIIKAVKMFSLLITCTAVCLFFAFSIFLSEITSLRLALISDFVGKTL